jgi:hypothetical protein
MAEDDQRGPEEENAGAPSAGPGGEPDSAPAAGPAPAAQRDVVLGFQLAWAWPAFLLVFFVISPISAVMSPLVFGIGLSQLPWVAGVAVVAHRKARPGILQGVLIGAGVILLLNGACWALLWVP